MSWKIERIWRKSLFLLPVMLFVFGMAGCGHKENGSAGIHVASDSITSIKLTCTPLCMQLGEPPFEERVFTSPDVILTFTSALDMGKKMPGVLDYGAYFMMIIHYASGNEREFVLNIDDEDGRQGLLVDSSNSEQGYVIPNKGAEILRGIIYRP